MPDRPPPAFAVVGEALLDLTAPDDEGTSTGRPGGSPMNVAIGLARLGQPTAFVGRMSDDPIGGLLRGYLRKSAVDLRYAVEAPEPSTIALVELADGQARYQFSLRGSDFQWTPTELAFLPGTARAVHFGSLASWLPPGDAAISGVTARMRREGSVLISYDPNIRPSLLAYTQAARRKIEQSVSVCHVVKASAEDLDWLYPSEPVGKVARRWLDFGAQLVVVTAGRDGASAWAAGQPPLHRPAYAAPVVDTVGAGDAFMAGLLDALARRSLLAPADASDRSDRATLAAILDDASLVAGITVSRPGADPPGRAEVDTAAGRSILGPPPEHD